MPSRRQLVVSGLTFALTESSRPWGSTAPAIVLVHGIGMSHRYLTRLHRELARETRVVSVDLPGFGGLPKPPADLDVVRMAAGLAEVVAGLGEEQLVLVGHSMGAQWVVETASQRPEKVRAVVLIGPVVDDRHRTIAAQARALAIDTLGESPRINTLVFTDYLRCGPRWYLLQVRHMLAYPLKLRLRSLPMPVLVIRGGADPVAGRAWCRSLRDAAGVGRLIEIPGHHHVVQESAPKTVAAAIRTHTDGTWPASAEAGGTRRGRTTSNS